jgi:hypothetical protein
MSKQVRLRRGTTADHATFTGADGEVTFDTDKKCLVVHDGATPGGAPVAGFLSLTGDQRVGGSIEFSGGTAGISGVPGISVDNCGSFGQAEVLGILRMWAVERYPGATGSLAYAATVNLPFDTGSLYQINLAGNVTFTTSGRSYGREIIVAITAGASQRTLTFPSWIFVGSAAPANIAANKHALLRLWSIGTTDSSVYAKWDVEP